MASHGGPGAKVVKEIAPERLSKDGRAIADMFDRVAPRYDALNRLLSLGVDRTWRRRLARSLDGASGPVLDLCTGTGDVLLTIADRRPDLRGIGVDFSVEMVRRGAAKGRESRHAERLRFCVGDGTRLAVRSGSMGAAVIAFGIRNVSDVGATLDELRRVLRPGGRLAILEFSLPRGALLRSLYLGYFLHILPMVGSWLSGDGAAYRYLPASVLSFPEGAAFLRLLDAHGFADLRETRLSFGLATLYVATCPD